MKVQGVTYPEIGLQTDKSTDRELIGLPHIHLIVVIMITLLRIKGNGEMDQSLIGHKEDVHIVKNVRGIILHIMIDVREIILHIIIDMRGIIRHTIVVITETIHPFIRKVIETTLHMLGIIHQIGINLLMIPGIIERITSII